MKTTTSVTLLALAASVAALPTSAGLWPRGCTPGRLVCNGNDKFGICDLDTKAVWMSVALGTECLCNGSDCVIAASGSPLPSGAPVEQPTAPVASEAPAASSPAATEPAPEPTVAAPTPSVAAPASSAPAQQAPPAQASSPAATQPTSSPSNDGSKLSNPPQAGNGDASNTGYRKTFLGNGDISQGWPAENTWVNFDDMWSENLKNVISKSCTGFGQADNTPDESAAMKAAITKVSGETGVDARYILAIVMQESNGCVRAPTTNYGVRNPGLMQSHDGPNSCFGTSPCPSSTIEGMIRDGTNGTPSGDGLKQLLAKAGGNDVSSFYKAARMYNSGSIAASGLLQDGIATHCYASDIANRLLGWSAGVGGCHIG
ncbi:hypothetical protein VHEMI03047 [[Torrubiella] hemipterigena]|uniref:Transglycosylase SLT domain-containing protein n=1 Tax=[Torrubiella] hemipterigena TaxID=1531966 RepID=A0A0A1SRD5_9HYPO|nr:hypothetical protein VHEMI03047 [[Torrubiella] hemipterigena]